MPGKYTGYEAAYLRLSAVHISLQRTNRSCPPQYQRIISDRVFHGSCRVLYRMHMRTLPVRILSSGEGWMQSQSPPDNPPEPNGCLTRSALLQHASPNAGAAFAGHNRRCCCSSDCNGSMQRFTNFKISRWNNYCRRVQGSPPPPPNRPVTDVFISCIVAYLLVVWPINSFTFSRGAWLETFYFFSRASMMDLMKGGFLSCGVQRIPQMVPTEAFAFHVRRLNDLLTGYDIW